MPVPIVHLLAEDTPMLRHRAGQSPPTPVAALLHSGPRSRRAGRHCHDDRSPQPAASAGDTAYVSLFVHDPLVSASGQFSLTARSGRVVAEGPSCSGDRPWGLRRMGPVATLVRSTPAGQYDPLRQVTVDPAGMPVVGAIRAGGRVAGPPTAPTTSTVDGEDPPSAEDYNNDFCPDEPDAA